MEMPVYGGGMWQTTAARPWSRSGVPQVRFHLLAPPVSSFSGSRHHSTQIAESISISSRYLCPRLRGRPGRERGGLALPAAVRSTTACPTLWSRRSFPAGSSRRPRPLFLLALPISRPGLASYCVCRLADNIISGDFNYVISLLAVRRTSGRWGHSSGSSRLAAGISPTSPAPTMAPHPTPGTTLRAATTCS
ncbi:unnamed protein product [Miscanthus lutarioriparius]|uniref:Uncharacterized protein n=1 Tax=Miscanthus lutarioriparius TaxID=422564 RepID=A0A811MWN2_9POAL|nr:unnamed protein product [Miscanthus lutarioriparius]